ncbi:NACHT C-terminal alpha/beta 1 domain-containing protein [Kamptonema formosum]|uniref:NACHT C-terminal alpha/beta 1 domain-containing protein n=1 Tax=Kamptonema formosum TaxID=331992 RepID=UPI00035E7396|nr:HEAT repeat domain-containing protein [Oscillatoria sp. PCC 10802]
MAELQKPGKSDKKGWTQQDLADRSGASIDTVKRFLGGKPIDKKFVIWITEALGLKPAEVVSQKEWDEPTPIDWREVCRRMLAQRLTSNRLMPSEGMKSDLEDMYVELPLVRQAQPDKRRGDVPAEQGSLLYEPAQRTETERFEYRRFLSDVLGTKKSDKIAIVGEGGAGKTTLSQKIAFWLLENTGDLAIWVSLGDLQGRSLGDYLREVWLSEAIVGAGEEIRVEWEQQFSERRVWLLLDGLDEMAASRRDALSLRGWLAQSRVVVTCRLNVWQANTGILDGFETYRTLPFQPEQVEKFIENYFRQNRSMGQSLWQALKQPGKERIKDLVRNPLRLMLLCSTWHWREGKLPDTKAELYEQFVETIYQWKKDRFPTTSEGRRQLNAKLGELALKAIDGEPTRFRLRHRFVCEVLGDPEDAGSPAELALQLGWLNKVGVDADSPHQPVYAFFHPTFQEYFAACAIPDWDFFLKHVFHNPKQGTYRIFEPQWKEVILLWLGREDVDTEKKEEFIKALVEFQDGCPEWVLKYKGFYEYRAYFLAAAGIAEFTECRFADDIVKVLVKWGLGTEIRDFSGHIEILKQLIKDGARQSYAPDKMTAKAKATLQETDRRRAIDALIELIRSTPNEDFRREAVESLGDIGIGNPEVKAVLMELMCNSPDDHIRMKAAESLGKIDPGNPEAIATLIDLRHNSADEYIRVEAPLSLKEIAPDHSEAARVLQPNLFLEYVNSGQLDPENPELIESLVKKVRSTPDGSERMTVVEYLGYTVPGNSEAVEALIEVIKTSSDQDVFREAVRSLGRIGKSDPKAIRMLIDLIGTSQNWVIRWNAVQSLYHAEALQSEAIWVLINLIRTNHHNLIRIAATKSLGRILQKHPLPSAVSALKNCLFPQSRSDNDCDLKLHLRCYDVLLDCAQTMPYPDYYEAWHSAPFLPAELLETTGIGSTPSTQSLNLSNLPQLLTGTLANDAQLSQSVKPICIDGSKFIDRHNPAAKIYAEMVKAGCPKCADGTPQTMPALQTYWDLLETDKRIALVFYENPNAGEPQGFSETFLDALRKFDGAICLVSEQPESRLKSFSPTQPNLVEDIVAWGREVILENF